MNQMQADRGELDAFVTAMFRYADEGTFISLRTFDQNRRDIPPVGIRSVKVNGSAGRLVDEALKAAQRAADHAKPTVFSPPIATFRTSTSAKGSDLANGVAMSVELDEAPFAARARLEGLLGPATLVVASGSDWIDAATGEVQPKLHLHWRLSEPTRTADEHAVLNSARSAASVLVGADPTGVPAVHCYRWPGSWNTKRTPRLCRIVSRNDTAELHLPEAADTLAEAVEAAGLASSAAAPMPGDPQAPTARIRCAMAAIPNAGTDVHYADWISLGYAVFNATGGAGEAFEIWDDWSQMSDKYNAGETEAAWKRIVAAISGTNAPRKIGAGTIVMKAKAAGWADVPATRPEDFTPPPEMDDPGYIQAVEQSLSFDPIDALMAEFNRRYMVVNEAGKAILYAPAYDPVLKRRYHNRMEFADLQKLHLNRTVRNGVDKKGEPVFNQVAQVWLRHRDRRQYIDGVTFDPSGSHDNPDVLNLWQGFAVKPKPGSWKRMQRHIFEVICSSKQELYDYVLNWMARLVQFPAQQGEVAIVLKGIEGAGKGIVARALLYILGQHGLTISHAKHLTGNFNSHLRDAVFLFADEAFYAGDKAHVGVLKALITEPTLTIEAKYQNAVQAPNFLHIMMASNEEWVVPAGLEARRFLVLLVASTFAQNRAHFAAIQKEMEAGGYEAMLHDLLNADLSGFDVTDVPYTEGLQEQKKLSLGTSEAWWVDILHRGYVWKSKLGLDDYFSEWHEVVATEVLYASYTEFARAHGERHPMAREAFGRFMILMGAKAARPRDAVVGEHITDVPSPFGSTRKAALIKSGRATGYHLGGLVASRAAFTDATKLDVLWEVEEQEAA